MTDCFLSPDRLAAYADGSLPESERAGVAQHLDQCARCRAELAWLGQLAAQTAALPRSLAPERELWAGVAARLESRRPRRFIRLQPMTLAAAAVILMLLTAGLTGLWLRQRSSQAPVASSGQSPITQPVGSDDQAAALATLVSQVRRLEQSLPPATRALVTDQLRQIDGAIHESEAALAGQHPNPAVERMLEARYQQRLALLEQASRVARSS